MSRRENRHRMRERIALAMRHEGKTCREIGAALHVTPGRASEIARSAARRKSDEIRWFHFVGEPKQRWNAKHVAPGILPGSVYLEQVAEEFGGPIGRTDDQHIRCSNLLQSETREDRAGEAIEAKDVSGRG